MFWYYFCRELARVLLTLLTRSEVKGAGHIPPDGPFIIIANHLSLGDPPILAVAMTRRATFMAKEELFRNPVIGNILRSGGAFPVNRKRLDRQTIRSAEEHLKAGLALIMFPEGTRSPDGSLQDGATGAAVLALRLGLPLLPVGICGSEAIGRGWWWLKRPRITVNIGKPLAPPAGDGRRKQQSAELTASIMRHIARLLPPAYRGKYGEENPKPA